MAQLSNKNSFNNIENILTELEVAAWVWDCDRNRIIAANGAAVKFWQELSVLDLIDTLFGEYHPVSLQFAKGAANINDVDDAILSVDFSSVDIADKENCEFLAVETEDDRHLLLIKVLEVDTTNLEDAASNDVYDHGMLARMLDNAPVALALFDQNGKYLYANGNCQQIFTKPTEVYSAPEDLSDWFTGETETLEEVKASIQSLIEKSLKYKIANISTKLNTAYGARTHSIVAKSFAIEPVNDGQPLILVYLRDVADERRYEQILVERIAKLEQLTQLGSDFYFILDADLDFVQLGGNFEKLTGYAASDLLGENWQTVAERFDLDPDGVAGEYFSNQKSFDNLNIEWPVKDSETGLSLTWRGRSIFEQQNGENIFVGNFVTAFENILAISDEDLTADITSISDHVELLDDEEDEIDDVDADLDKFEDPEEIAALAELDGASEEDLELTEDDAADDDGDAENDDQQTTDLELSALETNLNDAEAVNFASIAETLTETTETEQAEEPTKLDNKDDNEDDIEDVLARSDNVIAEINAILGETTYIDADKEDANLGLADNIVPAFGTTAEDIKRFGRTEVDIFKLILDQTPIMAVITSLPSEEGMFTLFANKEVLHNLGLIQDKNQELPNEEYLNILSVESMEYINSLKDEFSEIPLDQEISFLVKGSKHYFNAKINKIDWQDNKVLQYILSPKIDLDTMSVDTSNVSSITRPVVLELTNDSNDTRQQSTETIEFEGEDLLQFVLDGQAFIDKEQKILSSNVYLSNILGLSKDELIGKAIGDIVVESDFGAFQDYVNSVLQVEERNLSQDGIELELINRAGENHSVFMHVKRLSEDEAQDFPSDILVNMRDISMWKKKEASLLAAKNLAEQENKQKSGFLARISHELRTPLNAIIGFSEVMSDEKFGPIENTRYKGYAHDINESGEHLLSLINDLLDLSKVEAGKVELNFEALDLEPLILQSVSLMQPMADKKRIIIRTSISSTLPQIVADMRSIRQIILNLLSNSIKYSNPGSQVIMSALLDDDGEVIIRVRDTGVGMAEDQLIAAMEPFKTLDMSNVVDRQGTGLGLPLTKALAEANRADFSIESAVDAGTLVQITFPTTRVLNA